MEIVSEPKSIAGGGVRVSHALQQILIYGGVSDADMEKGQLRCDCNVSVRPEGQKEARHENRDQEHELDQRCAPRAGL
jgi:aspartyl-tRNA(Asn)/glutamyl-tRNA(Gln) amidotransferase subunit B